MRIQNHTDYNYFAQCLPGNTLCYKKYMSTIRLQHNNRRYKKYMLYNRYWSSIQQGTEYMMYYPMYLYNTLDYMKDSL